MEAISNTLIALGLLAYFAWYYGLHVPGERLRRAEMSREEIAKENLRRHGRRL